MATIGNNTEVIVKLNGKNLKVPREFFDLTVKASFDQNPQANLSFTGELTFIADAYQEILTWLENGNNGGVGIFEGIPLSIQALNQNGSIDAFNGFVDLQDGLIIDRTRQEIRANIKQDNGLNTLSDQLEALDYGFLVNEGVITESDYVDVDYVVDEVDDVAKVVTTILTIYLLQKQIYDTARSISETAADIIGHATGGGVYGGIGAAAYAFAKALLEGVYAAALLGITIKLGKELIEILAMPVRTHKAMYLNTLLTKACQYIGYGFNSTIADLNNIVFLPSNLSVDQKEGSIFVKRVGVITQGIPAPTDFGYTCPEMFQLIRDAFNARFLVDSNRVVQCHTESSNYWIKQASYVKPDILPGQYRYNTDELKSSININFRTDIADQYTIDEFQGTVYQVLTRAKTTKNIRNQTIKNLDLVSLPVALGVRKESLSGFEQILASLAGIFDAVAKVFKGRSNLRNQITNKIGVLKVSSNNHSVPKFLWLEGGRIPENHRQLLSAKTLWQKYHSEKSFVANNYKRQRKVVEGERIPFGFDAFTLLVNNSYFYNTDGNLCRALAFEWSMLKDSAIIDYWQSEPYTENLEETFIEPS